MNVTIIISPSGDVHIVQHLTTCAVQTWDMNMHKHHTVHSEAYGEKEGCWMGLSLLTSKGSKDFQLSFRFVVLIIVW